MSLLDPALLREMGIRPIGYRIPIPLYMKVRLNGPDFSQVSPEIISRQELSALVLQIDDHVKFSR